MKSPHQHRKSTFRKYLIGIFGSLLAIAPLTPVVAAELLLNPREVNVWRFISGQASTRVIASDVNVRNLPTIMGNGGFVFAQLDRDDEVYVLGCEGFSEGHFWVHIWIPEIGEIGYVAAEYLQNNYQTICDRTRRY